MIVYRNFAKKQRFYTKNLKIVTSLKTMINTRVRSSETLLNASQFIPLCTIYTFSNQIDVPENNFRPKLPIFDPSASFRRPQ